MRPYNVIRRVIYGKGSIRLAARLAITAEILELADTETADAGE